MRREKRYVSDPFGIKVRSEDGLILLITGNSKGPHGEFWLEPDEQIVVISYPEPAASTPAMKPKAGHRH